MDDFKNGQKLKDGANEYQVVNVLGEGGQGSVWLVQHGSAQMALKWYNSVAATPQQYGIINELVSKGRPDSRFLWPITLVRPTGYESFGYVMGVREKRFRELAEYTNGDIDPSRRALMLACVQLADCFKRLHAIGMCYGDVNPGNLAFDPETGDVCICDCDNIIYDNSGEMGTDGMGGFMAPEVVREEQKPSAATDRFSLAVMLFQMLVVHHPMEGRMFDEIPGYDLDKDKKIYGAPAPFIFHPTDKRNHLPPEQDGAAFRWKILPAFVKKRFIEAFVEKVNRPHDRVTETSWRTDFLKLHDSIMRCPGCNQINYYDREARTPAGTLGPCWKCKKTLPIPALLGIERGGDRRVVVLQPDTKLLAVHIGDSEDWLDLLTPLASVEAHPKKPGVLGLRNHSARSWLCTFPDHRRIAVQPGAIVLLQNKLVIEFGNTKGVVVC